METDTRALTGIKDRTVLVTGASAGIGQAIAIRFAEAGANVAVNYRKTSPAETEQLILASDKVRNLSVQADVSVEKDVDRMFDEIETGLGAVDILVNNAGIQVAGASHETTTEDFDRIIDVNLRSAYLCSRVAIRRWMEQKSPGVILNVSSIHDTIPKPGYLAYSVSKGGMLNLTRTLALEYSDKGIRVNGVAPGAIDTRMNRAWIDDPEKRAQVESHIPMRRAGKSWEVAAVAVFLASEEAGYITGQTIYVDGGLMLYPAFKENWSS